MSYKYLKDDVYYNDLYDRLTVEEGRRMEATQKPDSKDSPKEVAMKKCVDELIMHFFTGDRYKNKSTRIQAWKTEARRQDELLEKAKPLENIHCLQCNTVMDCEDKELWDRDKKDEVLFWYSCTKCKQRRFFFSDSREYRPEKKKCEKCHSVNLKEKADKKDDDLTITTTCLDCSYVDTYTFESHEEKPDPDFVKDRERFCLTDKEGRDYIDELQRMESLSQLMKEIEARDKERAEKLKEHPEGFHLFDGEGYTCPICGDSMTGTETWFDSHGQKCMKCKRNIENGVIPAELSEHEKRDLWLSSWSLQSKTGLHSATIRKLIRQGEIKARSLLDHNDNVYCQIFMVNENKEFLQKYKKTDSK